jgi:ribosomal protein S27E
MIKEDQADSYEVPGEVIKMIHGELPAVRWTCGGCGEDACTIFYEAQQDRIDVECESCGRENTVRRIDEFRNL